MQGLDVHLVGEANDYVGKGMNGGEISIVPPPGANLSLCRPHRLHERSEPRNWSTDLHRGDTRLSTSRA